MSLKFGTSGIRGLEKDLSDQEVKLITTAFLTYADTIGQLSDVAIGSDLRESSPRIKTAVIAAISALKMKSYDCGVLPTPALAFYAQKKSLLAIMITGSHIPADRNGIKFYLKTGETLKDDDDSIFKTYLELQKNSASGHTDYKQRVVNSHQEAEDIYLKRYVDFFPTNCLENFRLIFYQHSSVARDIYPKILRALGADVVLLGFSETFVPIDTEAVDATEKFKVWLNESRCDALISTDGDADRPLLVDEIGSVLPGDKIGALTSIFLKCEAVALPISCNSGIKNVSIFQRVVSTKIGSPFVVQALNDLSEKFKPVAGFEANGGYILHSDIKIGNQALEALPTRDAVLPVISLLALAKEHCLKVSEIISMLPKVYTASGLIKSFPTEKSLHIIDKARNDINLFFQNLLPGFDFEVAEVDLMDGLRCKFKNGVIIHLRPSGNAPEFRCYTEATDQTTATSICEETLSALSAMRM